MAKTESLVDKLRQSYSDIAFIESDIDKWSPEDRTVSYNTSQPHAEAYILHELSHGLLGHYSYNKDIELLQMEREAWKYAKEALSTQFGVVISDELIDTSLDTYRDWIHTKSTCPNCEASGLEFAPQQYLCICCSHKWTVNTGVDTHIKRYGARKLVTKKPLSI